MIEITCRDKQLTRAQREHSIKRAIELRPSNAAASRTAPRSPTGRIGGPRRLTLLTGHRWPVTGVKLTVRFLDGPSTQLKNRILLHMNAWGQNANISFVRTRGDADVRISRLDHPDSMAGYWSYVGTQILGISDQDEPTLNLEGFTMDTAEGEFKRVVRHEAGHTLGFEHEHMRKEIIKRIDKKRAVRYFDRTQGWSQQETMDQVLTPLDTRSIMGTTEADPISIMCYEIPGSITKDGKPIRGGNDINPKDHDFAGTIYPKKVFAPKPVR